MPSYKAPDENREYMRLYMQRRRAEGKAKQPGKVLSTIPSNDDLQTIGEFVKPSIKPEVEVEAGQPLWLVIALAGAIVFFVTVLIVKYL